MVDQARRSGGENRLEPPPRGERASPEGRKKIGVAREVVAAAAVVE